MKKVTLSILLCMAVSTVYAIIYRHDVPEKEYRQLAAQKQFNCVGEVFRDQNKNIASCVLISDRYVLCAAHVFIKSDTRADTFYIYKGKFLKPEEARKKTQAQRDSMNKMTVFENDNRRIDSAENYEFRFNRRRYSAKRIIILPNYMDSATRGECDIAIIELKDPVKDVTPATLCSSFDELKDTITCVGFGVSGDASIPQDVDAYYTKLAGQNIIDTLEGALYDHKRTLLGYDFDDPATTKYNVMGSSTPLHLEHICGGGDSGGGMFRHTANGWQLVGICSGSNIDVNKLLGIGYYGQTATYTRVSAFHDWIMDNTRQ